MRKVNLFALMFGCLLAVGVSWGQRSGENKTIIVNQNTGVTARAGLAGALAYPGQGETQPSQPATPEIAAGATTNLAAGKPAQQSSTYSGAYPASNGVDGRKDDGSMFHTNSESNPWWQVNLQGNYALTYIVLYNRTGCCSERERTVRVLLSQNGSDWQTIYAHNGTDFKELRVEAGGRQARYVRLQLAEQNYFHLQEVEVYGASAAGTITPPAGPTTNLAAGKPAQQSSTYSGAYPASNGVDGRKDDGSMFHTNSESNPWWQVNLQGNYALTYIVLYNRTGCCSERERTVRVLLSQNGSDWQTIYAHNGTDFKELRVEAGGRQARYVRLQLAEQNYFHLQEVEVYGASAAGTITPPAGPTTNLAAGKPAQQSSTYSGDYPASSGVDGRKDDGSMFHTNSESNPWWQVNLQGNYTLSYIVLYNRTGCCSERERTVRVLLSQNGSDWQTIYAHNGTDFKELRVEAGGRQARYVRLQLAEQNYLHLQEVEVYGAR